jgi:uncharacterized membrane protein YeaQ/YmgE (transglycosylase-associated protein family)
MGIPWIVFIGFVAGIIARFVSPGPNKPVGFILTTMLGIAGAFAATFYRPGGRLVSTGSRCWIHCGHARSSARAVRLEPLGR